MSKELVVSANRHETRVAIVEDDQVVEIYHQRENEYSLAGSIHKGRVTRVLPGMQSAFVDIGLDRDAFLYVSDFFEDNEEYDKIVTSVEDKVLKLDRVPAGAAPVAAEPNGEAPATAEPGLPDSGDAAAPGSAEPPSVYAAPLDAPAGGPGMDSRRDGRGDDRRGGRRSRRRRGQKGGGRGLPDSKYYSPRGEGEAAPRESAPRTPDPNFAPPPAAGTETGAQDFLVLPGESLAKHNRADEADFTPDILEESPAEDNLPEDSSPEIVERAAPAAEAARAPAPEAAPPPVEADWPVAATGAVEPAPAVEPEVSAVSEREAPVPADAAAPEIEAAEELEPAATDAAEPDFTEELADGPANESELAEALVDALEAPAQYSSDTADEGPAMAEDEGPEPARIPTSLTATLREQGPRYLHRVSRRMRRKGRGGPLPEGGRPQHEPRASELAPRAPEQRTVSAPRNAPESRPATASISDLLKEGQEIIVQIAKEPLGQKGARITSHIALPGRFLVYMPTVDHIGVSRKIPTDEERLRLKRILQTHRTGIPGGYIVRTAGEGRSEEELRADMMFLYNLWLDMRQKAERKPAPMLIHHDLNVVERVLRDQLTASFKSIWVDNEEIYESVLRFVQRFQPALVNRVKLYTRSTPIFDEFGITSELEKALRPKVWLKSGGHIVINQTEALVAIDINTGKYVGKSNRLEDTIVKTNTDAIREIVRQIRLRDLGGIIVVDFIDMDERKNRQKVMQALEEAMRADRAPYKILQFNDFGLVAITRKRVKQSLERTLCMPCPYCEGAGYVKSPQTVVGEILQEANKIARAVEGKDVLLRVSPEVAKLLKSNQNSYLQELEEILGRTVIVKSDSQLHQEKFDLA
jgi:ribonuclease G